MKILITISILLLYKPMSRNSRFSLRTKAAKSVLCPVWAYFALQASARAFRSLLPAGAKSVKFPGDLYELSGFSTQAAVGKVGKFSGNFWVLLAC